MTSESTLSVRARERPEAPFVFFRGRRGHFRWLSYAAAAAGKVTRSDGADWAPLEVHELVRFAGELEPPESPDEAAAPFLRRDKDRDVWISWRPLSAPSERSLAAAAIRGGAAIVVERRERFPLDLFLWARPTVVSASHDDLAAILARVEEEAPRWRRRGWLRQKLGRLRAILVEDAVAPDQLERLEIELRRLFPDAPASVRRFEPTGDPDRPALV